MNLPGIPGIPNDYRAVLALGAVALIAYWIVKRDVGAAARAVGTAINPLDERNLANRAVTQVGTVLTGSNPGGWSLGSWLYDKLHPEEKFIALTRTLPVQPQDRPTAFLRW